MLEIAQQLWELMHPGSSVTAGTPEVGVDGGRTTNITPYMDAKGQECYRFIAVELRWQSDAGAHLSLSGCPVILVATSEQNLS